MKSFNEAINVIKTNISNYQKLCEKANDQILSDKEAFFRNLIPFGKQYGGQTGFKRAEKFITAMEEEIKKGNITGTGQLIDFSARYPDKGNKLSDYIWKSIREAAGFSEAHINFLIPIYQKANEACTSRTIEVPGEYESRIAIENLFNRAICGHYDDELLKYLHSYLGLESNKCADYGEKLLNHLSSRISQLEQLESDMNQISLRNSH